MKSLRIENLVFASFACIMGGQEIVQMFLAWGNWSEVEKHCLLTFVLFQIASLNFDRLVRK